MNKSDCTIPIEKLTISDEKTSNPLLVQHPTNSVTETNEEKLNIDDHFLSTHQPPTTYDSIFINQLFNEYSVEDDQELIAVLKNCVNTINCHQEIILKLQNLICKLQSKMENVYEMIGKPQIIEIRNFDHLIKPTGAFSIEDQVNTLFFNACIPTNWKTSIDYKFDANSTCNKVNSVSITLLNYCVKEKTKELLNKYFKDHYSNIIYI